MPISHCSRRIVETLHYCERPCNLRHVQTEVFMMPTQLSWRHIEEAMHEACVAAALPR